MKNSYVKQSQYDSRKFRLFQAQSLYEENYHYSKYENMAIDGRPETGSDILEK